MIVDYLVKLLLKTVFKSNSKAKAFKINANSKQTTAVGEDNKNEFYVNIDRRLIKIEMALVNIVQAKGDYIHIKTESKIILFILH
jgi:DNA-binding LytR/AlgR family response regulator